MMNILRLVCVVLLLCCRIFAETHVIEFGGTHGDTYSPANLTVNVGDTVEWQGNFTFHPLSSTSVPGGAAVFSNSTGSEFQYVVTTAGDYDYRCDFHFIDGMVGSFTAVEPTVDLSQSFIAVLLGENETPPVETDAVGGGAFVLSSGGDSLKFWIRICNLGESLAAAHFHNAPAGVAGPVVRTLTLDFIGDLAAGVWTSSDAQPLTPALVQELLNGNIYVNVHTADHPAGKIRGQLTFDTPVTLFANLSGAQEVPPNGEPGSGEGTFELSGDGTSLQYMVEVQNLTGGIQAAHFHNAPAGVAGPVVRPVSFSGLQSSGTWTDEDPSPLTPALVAEILGCNIYVNVHTSCYPAGEIRGQLLLDDGANEQQQVTDVESSSTVVTKYNLEQNYPNPFNPSTSIMYSIPQTGQVKLVIYNPLGQEVITLVDEVKEAGLHSAIFNASNLPSGIYVYRLETGSFASSKKMTLIK